MTIIDYYTHLNFWDYKNVNDYVRKYNYNYSRKFIIQPVIIIQLINFCVTIPVQI